MWALPASDWARTTLPSRLAILRRTRHLLAARSADLAATISRPPADTLVAEVLPLLAAIRFLEQNADRILAPRHLGRRGLPFWLAGLATTIERVPLGTILIIGPANYPLLLPGVQAMQALAAGNTVVWKPGRGGRPVAELIRQTLESAGLPPGILHVTDDSIEAATQAIDQQPAKIVFTGSATAGRAIQHRAAELSIPVIAELSGCDAVFILPNADPTLVVDALAFGMRLNGSATCMAPRRLFLIGPQPGLIEALQERFATIAPSPLSEQTRSHLNDLLAEARSQGAQIVGAALTSPIQSDSPSSIPSMIQPLLILNAQPSARIAQADLFAPILTVFETSTTAAALALDTLCPYALTASIFGPEPAARALASQLNVGTVTINDLIVPTADPRIPFGGRRASGFGATRGAEGLLEMTAAKTTAVRQRSSRRHLQPTTPAHAPFFRAILELSHTATWRERLAALRSLIRAARPLQ